jgi:hypothetical protein
VIYYSTIGWNVLKGGTNFPISGRNISKRGRSISMGKPDILKVSIYVFERQKKSQRSYKIILDREGFQLTLP